MGFSSDDFEAHAATAMEAVASQLREVSPHRPECSVLLPFADQDRTRVLADLGASLAGTQTAIYAISLPEADPATIHRALSKARDDKVDGRSYSRVLPLGEAPSNVLYVGSSRTLRKRLMEHLGFGPKKTFSLHLRQWGHGLGPVRIDVRAYPADLPNGLLCALEDYMADQLRPLFGKRGSV